jgi:hypothetical protein
VFQLSATSKIPDSCLSRAAGSLLKFAVDTLECSFSEELHQLAKLTVKRGL